uniref:Uncharacterized protein n=1 Tax=Rousettus aegyptiacus TaxID=9407 RepID=A0A7J8H2P0_ROUAE|nr:hypothetical protein HJG63_011355 [Rousettus aegyptiacus]
MNIYFFCRLLQQNLNELLGHICEASVSTPPGLSLAYFGPVSVPIALPHWGSGSLRQHKETLGTGHVGATRKSQRSLSLLSASSTSPWLSVAETTTERGKAGSGSQSMATADQATRGRPPGSSLP